MKQPINQTVKSKNKHKKTKTDEYHTYINSKQWEKVKEYFFNNVYQKKCYCCGRVEGEDGVHIALHHNTYKFLYNEMEHPDCLVPLCNVCHYIIHQCKANRKKFRKN